MHLSNKNLSDPSQMTKAQQFEGCRGKFATCRPCGFQPVASSDPGCVTVFLGRCRISRSLLKSLWLGLCAGFPLVSGRVQKKVLVPVRFPQQLNVQAASYDVWFLRVFLLEISISGKHNYFYSWYMYILFAAFLWNKACTQSLPLGKCYESVIKGLYAFLVFVILP